MLLSAAAKASASSLGGAGGGYVKGLVKYIVMDGPEVTLMRAISRPHQQVWRQQEQGSGARRQVRQRRHGSKTYLDVP